jgi:hypothetical protein
MSPHYRNACSQTFDKHSHIRFRTSSVTPHATAALYLDVKDVMWRIEFDPYALYFG